MNSSPAKGGLLKSFHPYVNSIHSSRALDNPWSKRHCGSNQLQPYFVRANAEPRTHTRAALGAESLREDKFVFVTRCSRAVIGARTVMEHFLRLH